MTDSFRIEILASKAIEHLRLRLSAEQTPPIDIRFKGSEDIDRMIEHIRSRLKPSFKQQDRDVFHHSFNPARVRSSNVDLIPAD
jgi:hypothetical protein